MYHFHLLLHISDPGQCAIYILPNVIGDGSRRIFWGIFIKIPKVTSAQSSFIYKRVFTYALNNDSS